MDDSWHQRVATYVDHLDEIAATIRSLLERTQVDTSQVSVSEVEDSVTALLPALTALEEMVAQREELLRAADAPEIGLSLMEKLRSTHRPEDTELAVRCEQVSARIGDANHHAVSLFVCQFHLAEFSGELVRLLSGATLPATYARSDARSDARSASQQGGLFNESA